MSDPPESDRAASGSPARAWAPPADIEATCPPWSVLVRLRDPSCTPTEFDTLSAHVEGCPRCQEWACQTWPPEQPRVRVQARFGSFRASLHKRREAFAHRSSKRPWAQWTSVAALGACLATGFMIVGTHSVVVRADDLLNRAALYERSRPLGLRQHVRLRLRPLISLSSSGTRPTPRFAQLVAIRQLSNGTATEMPAETTQPRGAETVSIEQLLVDAQFDPRQPLSVQSFQAWRARLARKQDQITLTGNLETLRTTSSSGLLREVAVTMRHATGEVVREVLVFDGIGSLEIEEVGQWVEPTRPGTQQTAMAGTNAAATVDADVLQQAELDARLVLRNTSLDLSGHVRVANAEDVVRVEGVVASATERRMLSTRLASIPRVEVALRVEEPSETPAETTAISSQGPSAETAAEMVARHPAPSRTALSRWLDRTFGDGADPGKTTFVPDLERQMTVAMQHLAALQGLGRRYSDMETRTLSAAARAKLQQLLDSHYRALNTQLHGLNAQFAVLFGSTPRSLASSRAPADWRRRTETGLTHAAVLDRLIHDLLTRDDVTPAERASEGPDSVSQAFGDLWEAVNARPSSRLTRLASSE